MSFGFGVKDRGRKESKIAGGAGNIETARECDRLSSVDRFGASKFFEIALYKVGDTKQNLRSLCRGFFRPDNKRLLCGRDRGFDIARIAVCNLRVRLSGRRFEVVQILPLAGSANCPPIKFLIFANSVCM